MFIVMAGLPGTGKSTLAQEIAHKVAGVVLNKDIVRASLFPPDMIEYSTEQDDFCMSILFQVAAYMLRKKPEQYILVDGRTFSRSYQIQPALELAEQLQTPLKIIECVCSDETARRRLEASAKAEGEHPASNRNYELYLSIKARFEPILEPKLVVDTDNDLTECLKASLSYIRREV
jgi:adenylylsulfate kinase